MVDVRCFDTNGKELEGMPHHIEMAIVDDYIISLDGSRVYKIKEVIHGAWNRDNPGPNARNDQLPVEIVALEKVNHWSVSF